MEPRSTELPTAPEGAADPGARRAGVRTGLAGVVALLASLVAFLVAGPPDSQDVAGTVLYLAGALADITGSVLLVFAWIDRDAQWPPERVRTGVALAVAAIFVVCLSIALALGRFGGRGLRLGLIAASAVVLAAAVVPALRPAPAGELR